MKRALLGLGLIIVSASGALSIFLVLYRGWQDPFTAWFIGTSFGLAAGALIGGAW